MIKNPIFAASLLLLISMGAAQGQVTLSGGSYTEDFNLIGDGLPSGWTFHVGATVSTPGDLGAFTTDPTNWNASVANGNQFRNVAGYSTTHQGTGDSTGSQSVYTDRAAGWRASNAGTAKGALMLTIADTAGFANFSASVDVFTGNATGSALTVAFEYRIGATGDFTSVGSYTTTALADGVTALSADGVALSALDNQAGPVSFRVRGVSSDSNATHTLVVDNFRLYYGAIPEPAAASTIAGLATLAGIVGLRRRARAAGDR